jgi:propane monooxygenase coupling protein
VSEDRYKVDRTSSDRVGVTMSASVEGNAIGDLMSEKEGVEVTKYPAMLRIDGGKVLEFDMNEIAEYLGEEEFTTYDFEIETSTHYGQMDRRCRPDVREQLAAGLRPAWGVGFHLALLPLLSPRTTLRGVGRCSVPGHLLLRISPPLPT